MPNRKCFSPDYVNVGYRVTIIDVGLTHTLMRTDTGLELKVPNQIVLNSGILEYWLIGAGQRFLQVRYEFKIDYDPELVLWQVKETLKDLKQVGSIRINERSDKEYYIILIQFSSSPEEDWTALKSENFEKVDCGPTQVEAIMSRQRYTAHSVQHFKRKPQIFFTLMLDEVQQEF